MDQLTITKERPEEAVAAILSRLRSEKNPGIVLPLVTDFAAKVCDLDEISRTGAMDTLMSLLSKAPSTDWVAPKRDLRRVDVILIAVQPVELRAVRATFQRDGVDGGEGRKFDEFKWTNPRSACCHEIDCVITATEGPGNVDAAVAIAEIAQHYSASLWVLLGMSAGVDEETVPIGTVVLPQMAWYYEPGRQWNNKIEPRPELEQRRDPVQTALFYFEADSGTMPILKQRFAKVIEDIQTAEGFDAAPPKTPPVQFGHRVVASGEKQLRDGQILKDLHEKDQNIVIADMESYGFAHACRHANWLIARGVSDYCIEKEKQYQYAATCFAAETVRALMESPYLPPLLERHRNHGAF